MYFPATGANTNPVMRQAKWSPRCSTGAGHDPSEYATVEATATASGSRAEKSGMSEISPGVRRNSARRPGIEDWGSGTSGFEPQATSRPSGMPSPSVSGMFGDVP